MRVRWTSILTLVLATILGAGAIAAAQGNAPVNVATKEMPVAVTAGDYVLVNQVLDIPPGVSIGKHTHGGPAVVTVISGELTVTDPNGTATLKAGQSATEPMGYAHSVVNKGTTTARVSVSYLIPKGAAMTTMSKM